MLQPMLLYQYGYDVVSTKKLFVTSLTSQPIFTWSLNHHPIFPFSSIRTIYLSFSFQSLLLCYCLFLSLQAKVATCISIGAGADVAGRFTLAVLSSTTPFNTRILFYVATLFTFVMRLGILFLSTCVVLF